MTAFRILILLPVDRARPGQLHLFDPAGSHVEWFPCLGKADNARAALEGNPDRTPTKPYGDTPTGQYRRHKVVAAPNVDKLGPRWLPLIGSSGPAAIACGPRSVLDATGGRTGLGIHAGKADEARTIRGDLVPTHGCVRILPNDAEDLWAAIGDADVIVTVEDLA